MVTALPYSNDAASNAEHLDLLYLLLEMTLLQAAIKCHQRRPKTISEKNDFSSTKINL
jgi:hypothetical protein